MYPGFIMTAEKPHNSNADTQTMYAAEQTPCSRRKKNNSAGDRLYDLAKKKRELEDSRKKAHQEEQFKRDMKPRKLMLQSKRSYTPQRERNYNEGQNIHTRLYSIAGSRKAALEKATLEKEKRGNVEGKLNSSIETSKRSERLYAQSLRMQLEGRQRREQISEKHRKRAPKTFGKISVDDAKQIYQRGMMMKVELEAKRQDNALDPYVSPLLNPLVLQNNANTTTSTPSKKPSRSASRCRSQTRRRNDSDLTSPPKSSRRSVSRSSRLSVSRSRAGASERPSSRSKILSNDVMKNPRIPSQNRSSSRIRSRSRLNNPAQQHQPSLRSPSPKVMRLNAGTSSNPWSVPGLTEIERDNTPQRSDRQHSIKDMLRRMEEDVSFYNDVKKAASMVDSRDDYEEDGLSFEDDDESEAERPKELPENVEISTHNLDNGASPEKTSDKKGLGLSPNSTLLNVEGSDSNLSNLSNDWEDSKDEYGEGRDVVEGDGNGDGDGDKSGYLLREFYVHPQSTELLHV